MKCVKYCETGEIRRVSDDVAYNLTNPDDESLLDTWGNPLWEYCPKSEWRASDPTYESRRLKKEEV